MTASSTLTLADGRDLGFDDVGDPEGAAVIFVHGTPDSRRSRHPDDDRARALGVRLVAVDRPGTIAAGQTATLVAGQRGLSIAQAFAGKFAKHAR